MQKTLKKQMKMNNIEFIYIIISFLCLTCLLSYTFYSIGWRQGYDNGYDDAYKDFQKIFNELKKRHQ